MANQLIGDYTARGLTRLAKEELVTIISTLQDMQAEVALKTLENIPEFFKICNDALCKIDGAYRLAIEGVDRSVQQQIELLTGTRALYEKDYNTAKTDEEKEKYRSWISEVDRNIQAVQEQGEKSKRRYFTEHSAYVFAIGGLAAASIGVTIKLGKRHK